MWSIYVVYVFTMPARHLSTLEVEFSFSLHFDYSCIKVNLN